MNREQTVEVQTQQTQPDQGDASGSNSFQGSKMMIEEHIAENVLGSH